jgi:hypothetical protein
MEDVRLPKVGEEAPKPVLPRGVSIIRVDSALVFVRKAVGGRLFPLPQKEQEALARKLGLIE